MTVLLTPQASDRLNKLPKDIHTRIRKKLTWLSTAPDPLALTKSLTELPPSTHRLRVGDYRALFHLENNNIVIDYVGHRKDVYKLV